MTVTVEELNGPDVMIIAMKAKGITPALLARKLKAELNAKVTRTQKINGKLDETELSKGIQVIASTSETKISQKGNEYEVGQCLLSWNEIDWATRQKARIDAHKLLGNYPAEKHHHTGSVAFTAHLSDEDRKLVEPISKSLVNAIIDKHRKD